MLARPLYPALQLVAERELNEFPSRIPEELVHLREWIAKQPHLRARTDDQWLLLFLRGCKHSLERTKEKLDAFYTMRSLLSEYFTNRDPFLPELQEFFQKGFAVQLPNTVDESVIVLWRGKDLNPETVTPLVAAKALLMIGDTVFPKDDNSAVAGMQLIIDCENIPYKFALSIPPVMVNQIMMLVQKIYPIRTKAVHCINIPSFLEPVLSTVKKFANTKMKSRLHFYTSKNLDDLSKFIPLSFLPNEYGGQAGPIDEMAAKIKQLVESNYEWFKEDAQFGTDESKRPGEPITTHDMFGVEGSFRKLEID